MTSSSLGRSVDHKAEKQARQMKEPSRQAISYLDKAEECECLAAQAQDPDIKAALVSITRQWRMLARQIERLRRDRPEIVEH